MDCYIISYQITPSDNIKFKFFYDPAKIIYPFDFHISADGISDIQWGYDTDLLHFYPGNLTINIIDYSRNNLHNFFSLKNAYNHSQPFNHWNTFYLEIYRNNQIIFKGILDSISDDWDNETLSLSFTDATNLFRSMSFKNLSVILSLISSNFGELKIQDLNPLGYNKILYYFGLNSIAFYGNGNIDTIYPNDQQLRDNYNLYSLILKLLKIFNPNISLGINIPYTFSRPALNLYGNFNSLYLGCAHYGDFKPHPIYSLFGRYMFVKDEFPFYSSNLLDHFDYIGKFYISQGLEGPGYYALYNLKNDAGITPSFSDFFKLLSNSFSANFGFTDFNHAFLWEFNTPRIDINTAPYLRDVSRESFKDIASYIDCNFKLYNSSSSYGDKTADSELNKSIDVLFDTFNIDNLIEGNLYLRHKPQQTYIYEYIDTVYNTGVPGPPYGGFMPLSKVAAYSHFISKKGNIFKYNLSLNGLHSLFSTFVLNYYNKTIKITPTEINYNIISNISKITGLSLPPYY